MCKQSHGVAVDYYALGIIAYECMLGQVTYHIIVENKINNRDLMLEEIERKLEIKFSQNKFK